MKNNWLYIAVIAVLVIFAMQFWDSAPTLLSPENSNANSRKQFPYAMIEQPHSKHFDEQGGLSYEFIAQRLRHYRIKLDAISEGDYTLVDAIEVTLYTADSKWFVTADEGKLTDAGNTLTLASNVRIWQPLENGGETELTTSELVILPKDKIVTTDKLVNISAPQGKMQAVGMEVDLETKNIQLKSEVQGYHEPI